MKTVKFTGKAGSAWGTKLKKAVHFSGSFQAYEKPEELKAVTGEDGWPSDATIVNWKNRDIKAAAKAKAQEEALKAAGHKKPDLSDPATRRKRMIADYVAMGMSEENAVQTVDAALTAMGISVDTSASDDTDNGDDDDSDDNIDSDDSK